MPNHPNGHFQCPLRGPCFATAGSPFATPRAANEAVSRYQSCASTSCRQQRSEQLYMRHLPLVRKTLARLCPKSKCYPGGCLVEELVGETYPIFRQALDDYEPSFGLDFLGYASQRLEWGLEHRVRRLRRSVFRAPPPQAAEEPTPLQTTEERLLDRLLAHKLLARLSENDAALMADYAAGHTCREMAESAGISPAAVRKRLERLRVRIRTLSKPEAASSYARRASSLG